VSQSPGGAEQARAIGAGKPYAQDMSAADTGGANVFRNQLRTALGVAGLLFA
jgi:hypothetical protein